MLKKNIEKQKRKERKTWVGLKPKREATKKERLEKQRKKHKAGPPMD